MIQKIYLKIIDSHIFSINVRHNELDTTKYKFKKLAKCSYLTQALKVGSIILGSSSKKT